MKFNLGQRVKVIKDTHGFFIASEGTVNCLGKNANGKKIYGISFYKIADPFIKNIGDEIYYFEEDELESIDDLNLTYTFVKGE